MPVAVFMEFEGATAAQYDQVIQKMGSVLAGRAPRADSFIGWPRPIPA